MTTHRAFFETLAEQWDAQQPSERAARLRGLLAPLDSLCREAGAILDVGSGTGALLPLLRERAPHARLMGIDLAFGMLDRARGRDARASLAQSDVHALPFIARAFDLIVCHSSFPHFADKRAALGEFWRALRGGGVLVILHDISREQVNAIHAHASNPVIHTDLLPRGDEMGALLHAAGFADVRVEDAADHYLAVGVRR